MTPAEKRTRKRIKEALRLFEWHVTHTFDGQRNLCVECFARSVYELNRLTRREFPLDHFGSYCCDECLPPGAAVLEFVAKWRALFAEAQ